MTITVTHAKVSAIPDSADAGIVKPSDWNANHVLTGSLTAAQMPALTGDITTSAGSVATTLATVATGATTGSSTAIPVITFNNKGLVTSVTTASVSAAAGSLSGTTLASNVVNSSLTGLGTITVGVWNGTAIANAYLANSSITVGSTSIALGSSSTSVIGLTHLAVGTDSSSAKVGISRNATAWTPVNSNTSLHIVGADSAGEVSIEGQAFNTDMVWNGSRANGTAASPTALAANDQISTFVASGNDGSGATPQQGGTAAWFASQIWTATHHGCDWRMYGINDNTTSLANFLTIRNQKAGFGLETSPGYGLVYSRNATAGFTSPVGNDGLGLIAADTSGTMAVEMQTFGNPGFLYFYRANGTNASKTVVTSGQQIAGMFGAGWDGGQFRFSAGIYYQANQTYASGTAAGTSMIFQTTPDGSVTVAEAMRLWGSKGLSVGVATDPGSGGIFANVALGVGTNTTTATFVAIAAGTTAKSQINLAASTAPSAPNDGDYWFDGTNLVVRISSASSVIARAGKQTIWIPAVAMKSRATNGSALNSVEMSTNKNMVTTLDYDTTTQEFAQVDIPLPKSWNNGTITFVPYWSHPATTTNFGVVWGVDAVAISDGDALDVAFGTEQTSTDTGGTTDVQYVGPESSAITIAGTPATADMVQFRIHRNPAAGSDTLAVDARLHGVKLFYTTSAANDA